MLCKRVLALFIWCHCYQVLLDPFLTLIGASLFYNPLGSINYGGQINHNAIQTKLGLYVAAGSPITVAANRIALTPGQEVALRCDIADFPDIQFSWTRVKKYPIKNQNEFGTQEGKREELSHSDERFTISNNAVVIKSSSLDDVGDYTCQVKNPPEDIETEKTIQVRPRPYINDFNIESSTFKSAVVEEGKSLKLYCNIYDDYSPESALKVSWQMSKFDENDMNDVNSGEEGIRLETYNSTSYALIIDNVTKDHRRIYKCQVSNGIGENSKAILIRVKGKYIAIWPAAFIIGELVILMGVIGFAENRKVEPDKDTYDRKAKL